MELLCTLGGEGEKREKEFTSPSVRDCSSCPVGEGKFYQCSECGIIETEDHHFATANKLADSGKDYT